MIRWNRWHKNSVFLIGVEVIAPRGHSPLGLRWTGIMLNRPITIMAYYCPKCLMSVLMQRLFFPLLVTAQVRQWQF